jgi:Sigma-70, region 4
MRWRLDMSEREIADAMEIAEKTVSSHLSRARAELRSSLTSARSLRTSADSSLVKPAATRRRLRPGGPILRSVSVDLIPSSGG